MIKNKTILIGLCGGIAIYKMIDLVNRLTKEGADVHVIMTENAIKFISPLIFETLSGNKCIINMFGNTYSGGISHVELAKKADLFLIAPATANTIAKLSNGLADNILTSTALTCNCKKIIAPAMNTNMLENKITINNMKNLKENGYTIIPAEKGILACKENGLGKLANIETIYNYILYNCITNKDFKNKKILITAGPTIEPIDSVRYISNYSSGKMGYALAKAAMLRGADVTLVSGPTNLSPIFNVNIININSAEEMFEEIKVIYKNYDIIIKSAAVSDYTPSVKYNNKIKKDKSDIHINCKRTVDILSYIGENKLNNQILCGFCMETENLLESASKKMKSKNANIMIANSIGDGSGFRSDNNTCIILNKNDTIHLDTMTKFELSNIILDNIKSTYLS